MSQEIRKWGDDAQYVAAPMNVERTDSGAIIPRVKLLWMTPDPLGAIAAMARMYEGKVTYNLFDINDDERRKYFADMQRTHLPAPLEAVKLHFMIEGVTRAFTHQMVRQRTAAFAQESLRFAVKEESWAEVVSLPPSLVNTEGGQALGAEDSPDEWKRNVWDQAVGQIEEAYKHLVWAGMPAEEARGLMPHAMTTRLDFVTDLRNLAAHAGNRLCTQAQFEWRIVFMEIMRAIKNYTPDLSWTVTGYDVETGWADDTLNRAERQWAHRFRWQFHEIAKSPLFRPACYQLGRCPFKASFDRPCSIRKRVDAFAASGIPSHVWDDDSWMTAEHNHLEAIEPEEWMMNPAAARQTSGGGFD